MDGAFEPVAVELESGFLMVLDYMIQLAQKDADDEVLDSHCLTQPKYLFATHYLFFTRRHCREIAEHLTPLWLGFHIYSHKDFSTITIRSLNIYISNTPTIVAGGSHTHRLDRKSINNCTGRPLVMIFVN